MSRTINGLRNALTLSQFYLLAQSVALFYSSTEQTIARSKVMERFDLTESTFYTLLEFAVTHHLVDDETVSKIQEKILANQAVHGNKGYYSKKKYNSLIEKRNNYSAFTKKDIKEIATFYATTPEKSKRQIAKYFGFHNTIVLDQILKKACIDCIISDKVYKQLLNRSLQKPKNLEKTLKFFSAITTVRAQKKKASQTPPAT